MNERQGLPVLLLVFVIKVIHWLFNLVFFLQNYAFYLCSFLLLTSPVKTHCRQSGLEFDESEKTLSAVDTHFSQSWVMTMSPCIRIKVVT